MANKHKLTNNTNNKSQQYSANTVTGDQADLIHKLLCECFETSLRQQLLTGDFNAQILGKVMDFLKHNNISVADENVDEHLSSLARIFRSESGQEEVLSWINDIPETQASEYHR